MDHAIFKVAINLAFHDTFFQELDSIPPSYAVVVVVVTITNCSDLFPFL